MYPSATNLALCRLTSSLSLRLIVNTHSVPIGFYFFVFVIRFQVSSSSDVIASFQNFNSGDFNASCTKDGISDAEFACLLLILYSVREGQVISSMFAGMTELEPTGIHACESLFTDNILVHCFYFKQSRILRKYQSLLDTINRMTLCRGYTQPIIIWRDADCRQSLGRIPVCSELISFERYRLHPWVSNRVKNSWLAWSTSFMSTFIGARCRGGMTCIKGLFSLSSLTKSFGMLWSVASPLMTLTYFIRGVLLKSDDLVYLIL